MRERYEDNELRERVREVYPAAVTDPMYLETASKHCSSE